MAENVIKYGNSLSKIKVKAMERKFNLTSMEVETLSFERLPSADVD